MRGSLESAIDELVARFGFEARPLVLEVVLLIAAFPGGVDGFIDKFSAAGLGSEVTSWLGRSDGAVLMGPQVERALGNTVLGGIWGVAPSQTPSAICYRK